MLFHPPPSCAKSTNIRSDDVVLAAIETWTIQLPITDNNNSTSFDKYIDDSSIEFTGCHKKDFYHSEQIY